MPVRRKEGSSVEGERRSARERDVTVAAMVATQIVMLTLVLRNESW